MNGHMPISKDTWVKAKEDDRWPMLYDMLEHNAMCTQERRASCEKRFETIERRGWIERAIVVVVGAIAAYFGWRD